MSIKKRLFYKLIFPFILIIIIISSLNIILLFNFVNLNIFTGADSETISLIKLYILKIILITTVSSSILGIIIYIYFIRKYLIFPINILINAMKNISYGNLSQKIKHSGSGELEILARQFNMMIDNLKRSKQDLRKIQDRLARQEKINLLGNLSAGISHELNNPVNNISLHLELLSKYLNDNNTDNAKSLLNKIEKEITRISDIASKFSEFSKLSVSKKISVSIEPYLKELIMQLEYLTIEKHITISIQNNTGHPEIKVNIEPLEYVLINIIKNAVEVSPDNSGITVTVSEDTSFIFFYVTDSGPGIPENNITKIFEPFYSGKKDKGTGLGLAISKQLLSLYGGNITAVNNTDKGSTFTVSIPKKS